MMIFMSAYFIFFLLLLSFSFSLRSDIRTDSLVDMVKKQQAESAELARIYRDQNQDD